MAETSGCISKARRTPMVTRPEKIQMSVEEYLELDRSDSDVRYEYIDGYAYAMSGGTPQHAMAIGNFQAELNRQLRQQHSPCRAYPSDATVWISETRYVHPDVLVTCDENDRTSTTSLKSPRVVIEVLSPNTEKKDRREKFDWYRACPSIQEIVLVRTTQPLIEVYRRHSSKKQWILQFYGPGEKIELESLGLQIPLDVIYEEITSFEKDDDK
jgi:Uma2 family endonuclease